VAQDIFKQPEWVESWKTKMKKKGKEKKQYTILAFLEPE